MSTKFSRYLVMISIVLLSACSSSVPVTPNTVVDLEYVNQVEAAARKNTNVPRIYWVNPPLKKQLINKEPQS